jgi:isoleucyl-tRNA synthetase
VAEEIYQNLVCSAFPDQPESVHLAEWPQADPSLLDEGLMTDTRLVMRVASLGRNARAKAGVKVRQPLSTVVVAPRAQAEAEALRPLEAQVLEELNVKKLEVVTDKAALQGPGLAVAEEGGYTVALDTTITPDLADEGLAREIVHRLQTMRKNAGFDIADYITTHYQGDANITRVLRQFEGYVRQETLSRELVEDPPPEGAYVEEHKLADQSVRLAVKRLPPSG